MKILAFDTSGGSFSAALCEKDRVLAEETIITNKTHARHVMPVIDRVLSLAGIEISELDLIAVSRGPGSFTGLRIGLGVAKGLSYALSLPVVGISTLDALVWPFRDSAKSACAIVDARRGEVYTARYNFSDGVICDKTEEMVCSPEQAVKNAEDCDLFCGSGVSAYIERMEAALEKKIVPLNIESVINASDIAFLAACKAMNNDGSDPSAILPVYLRRSEAEINFEIRNSSV